VNTIAELTEHRTDPLAFALTAEHEAHEPPEARGLRRDAVRLLVSRGAASPVTTYFTNLGTFLEPGDLLVVNTSSTIPAALDGRLPGGDPIVVHLSGLLPGDIWLVEPRRPFEGATTPFALDDAVVIDLDGGGQVRLLDPFQYSHRLWLAKLDVDGDVQSYAARHGRPIRYRHVGRDWPLTRYQTVFGREPGSAEMPSASRPFTDEMVTNLITRGVQLAPLLLHTGVSSLEGGETPYPERYRVPASTAAEINETRARGGQVVAVGTTVVRAVATVTDERGIVHPGQGWTDVVVSRQHPVRSLDGLLTGWHEPESSHLLMLEAFASAEVLADAYRTALDEGFLWHEFGDSHLLVRERGSAAR
jgi:S-adenosylmethionine:tRNA ribosyltransferase-isomerase